MDVSGWGRTQILLLAFFCTKLDHYETCADPENFLRGGGGGVQIPRRDLTEIFNMAKTKNLAILIVGTR